jgi:hypothetical protein
MKIVRPSHNGTSGGHGNGGMAISGQPESAAAGQRKQERGDDGQDLQQMG